MNYMSFLLLLYVLRALHNKERRVEMLDFNNSTNIKTVNKPFGNLVSILNTF